MSLPLGGPDVVARKKYDEALAVIESEGMERAALESESDRLREALAEAIELADEGWAYASEYFVEKWDYDRRRDRLAALAEAGKR